ncbi:uncharacterized protein cubi_03626 [Cryptosporidium ubiquitum]|uniref:Uncharacterized protein n=1 Tax=Cryptosporidium ubiquitum TaxID=857276 RepID=A0A1J4MLT1_9CRYT|nr:uncharacterized protein cubi_03626 [Cryptosporidium ubiquitum]OII73829.1 hypothetical protein cubi_03626 [Cryptosporidium ubiquitum]
MASLNDNNKDSQGSQLIDLNGSEKNDYIGYMSHLQNSAAQLRYENNILKNDNANLVSKLDRAVSKSRNGVEIPEKATTAEIAEAFEKLNEENCRLKREMERLIRSNTRLRVAMQNRDPSLIPPEEQDKSYFISSEESGTRLCQCEYILNEILEAVSYKLETYEKHIWEHRLATLTNERDEIAVQNISLVDRLAEIEAIIKVDHVLAERFNVPLEGCDEKNQILTLHRKLGFALDVNQQLERRLAFETQLSRSWQSNMHTIVSESNGCEIFRSISSSDQTNNIGAGGIVEAPGYRKADRESLKLLRLAKQRIEADTKRLETCNKRIIELENEVASLRVRNHSYIYMEGAINHDTASKEIMKNILPPPKMSAQDLTGGLIRSFSKARNDNNLFSVNNEGILNVKLDKIYESKDGDDHPEENQGATECEVNGKTSSVSKEKDKSSYEIQDLEEGSVTHRSHHNSHRSHSQSRPLTHRSHKSASSNDNHSKTSKTHS